MIISSVAIKKKSNRLQLILSVKVIPTKGINKRKRGYRILFDILEDDTKTPKFLMITSDFAIYEAKHLLALRR